MSREEWAAGGGRRSELVRADSYHYEGSPQQPRVGAAAAGLRYTTRPAAEESAHLSSRTLGHDRVVQRDARGIHVKPAATLRG